MTHYMPQDLFDTIVLALALARFVGEDSPEKVKDAIGRMNRSYLDFYKHDHYLTEAQDCADRTLEWLRGLNPGEEAKALTWLAALNEAAEVYLPNGERKPWRLINGLWFTSTRQPPPDRRIQYFKNLTLYFVNIQTGKIPSRHGL